MQASKAVKTPEPKLTIVKNGEPKLKKCVSLFDATVYGVGIILGAGIYALIGEAAGIAGNAMWMSFVLAAIIASFTAISYAELSSLFPKSAAEFVYVKRATKWESIAFTIGIITVFESIIAAAAVALGFAGYFATFFFPGAVESALAYLIIIIALILIVVLSIINFIGMKQSIRLNIIFTAVEALGLFFIIIISIPFLGSVDYFQLPFEALSIFEYLSPVALGAALIFFAYIGFEDIANIAEEAKNASRTVPRALLYSLIITTIIYILVAISVVSVVPAAELAASKAPMAAVATEAIGPIGDPLFTIIALFATLNTVLIILIVGSRMMYGMSKEGNLPKILSRVHAKTKTPYVAIILTCLISLLFVLLGDIRVVAFLTNYTVFLTFLAVNASLIILRYTQPDLPRPFKTPLNIGRFPVISFLGVLFCLFMFSQLTDLVDIAGIKIPVLVFGIIVTLLVFLTYYAYSRLTKKQ